MTNLMGTDFCNALLLWGSNVLDQTILQPPLSISWGQLGKSGTFDKPSPTELSAFEEAIQWLQCSYFLLVNSFLMGKLMKHSCPLPSVDDLEWFRCMLAQHLIPPKKQDPGPWVAAPGVVYAFGGLAEQAGPAAQAWAGGEWQVVGGWLLIKQG